MSEIIKYPGKNDFTVPGSFLPKVEAPLDIRTVTQNYASLKDAFTKKNNSGEIIKENGVAVTDPDKVTASFLCNGLTVTSIEERCVYICIDKSKAATDDGWKKISGGLEGTDSVIFNKSHVHSIGNAEATDTTVTLPISKSYKSGDEWLTEENDIVIPAATKDTAGVITAADKKRLHKVAYGTCDTAANVAEKVITLHPDFADWKLEVGAEFVVKFSVSNSAAGITLNVNGTGAKNVWYNNSLMSGIHSFIGASAVPTRFMYDGTNYVWMGHAKDYYEIFSQATLGQGYGTCTTAEVTTAKVVTLANYVLHTGGIVSIKFTYAVPANSTLNINSKGVKPIFYRGSAIVAGVINAGDVATFIYDGTNYIYLGTDNALSKSGGKITGDLTITDDTDDVVEIDAQGITLRDTSDDTQPSTKITHSSVESNTIKKTGGTSDQILLADGSTTTVMKDDEIVTAINTAWGS